jgi:hypothetical protein
MIGSSLRIDKARLEVLVQNALNLVVCVKRGPSVPAEVRKPYQNLNIAAHDCLRNYE